MNRNLLHKLLSLLRSVATVRTAAVLKPAKGGPTAAMMPSGANPAAKGIWKSVLSKYGNRIYKNPDAGKQWGQAVFVFVKSCEKRGVEPYLKGVRRAELVRKAMLKFSRHIKANSHIWKTATYVKDFHIPSINLAGKWSWTATVAVDLRLSPCITVTFVDAANDKTKKIFGRGTVSEIDLDAELTKVMNWLEKKE